MHVSQGSIPKSLMKKDSKSYLTFVETMSFLYFIKVAFFNKRWIILWIASFFTRSIYIMALPIMEFQYQGYKILRIGIMQWRAYIMALPFMEFQDQGYKTRKIFEKKITYPKEIIKFWELDSVACKNQSFYSWLFWSKKIEKLVWIRC